MIRRARRKVIAYAVAAGLCWAAAVVLVVTYLLPGIGFLLAALAATLTVMSCVSRQLLLFDYAVMLGRQAANAGEPVEID